ncbi:MAG: c-type cytochrome [Aquabacterium commune]|uniref:c-type cytochrome n=1 Tax=Aquabacterium TaxID=92793 RepID=UPI0025BF8B7B|nr:c-type cytochrome [Aquabacterium sp.]
MSEPCHINLVDDRLAMRGAPSRWLRQPAGTLRPAVALSVLILGVLGGCGGGGDDPAPATPATLAATEASLAAQGRDIFRQDTFGNEIFWTDTLRMHEVIESSVSPAMALSVGLKVDADALPAAVRQALLDGTADLQSPATTLALIEAHAVVGVRGTVETVNGVKRLTRMGITCALCHSTVDDSLAQGIGRRLDGWANRDLDPGRIIALSQALSGADKAIYNSWGVGKFDPRHNVDGLNKPVVIPPAYGLAGVHRITLTGDGDRIAYWNRYVAVVEMGGQGHFEDARLNLNITRGSADLVSGKLDALEAYQLSLAAPTPPAGSFDPVAAVRGQALFAGKAQCVSCHSGAQFTDANERLHPRFDSIAEADIGGENPSYASRSATKQYRTTPLKGVWQHAPYFHDGSSPTLSHVVGRYNQHFGLQLTQQEISDLTEYLKSL